MYRSLLSLLRREQAALQALVRATDGRRVDALAAAIAEAKVSKHHIAHRTGGTR